MCGTFVLLPGSHFFHYETGWEWVQPLQKRLETQQGLLYNAKPQPWVPADQKHPVWATHGQGSRWVCEQQEEYFRRAFQGDDQTLLKNKPMSINEDVAHGSGARRGQTGKEQVGEVEDAPANETESKIRTIKYSCNTSHAELHAIQPAERPLQEQKSVASCDAGLAEVLMLGGQEAGRPLTAGETTRKIGTPFRGNRLASTPADDHRPKWRDDMASCRPGSSSIQNKRNLRARQRTLFARAKSAPSPSMDGLVWKEGVGLVDSKAYEVATEREKRAKIQWPPVPPPPRKENVTKAQILATQERFVRTGSILTDSGESQIRDMDSAYLAAS